MQCKKKNRKKYLQVWRTSYFWALRSFEMFTCPLCQIELHSLSTVLFSGFQSSRELWNPLSTAVSDKIYGPGGHSEYDCLQDWTNFPRSSAWQIVLTFISALWNISHSFRWVCGCKVYGDCIFPVLCTTGHAAKHLLSPKLNLHWSCRLLDVSDTIVFHCGLLSTWPLIL